MGRSLRWLWLSLLCLFYVLYLYFQKDEENKAISQTRSNSSALVNQKQEGNLTIDSFDKAKRHMRKIYEGYQVTFYCGCKYSDAGIDFSSCGFKSFRDEHRAKRIEWEHVVPASDFGRSFVAWREGDSRCRDRGGKTFKGRKCARLVSPEFNRMEADLYNLVPAIGEVNGLRKDYPMGLLPDSPKIFGRCQTKIDNGFIEPREAVRGFIARTYKYMNKSYSGHGIISRKNEKLFDAWDKQYPPDLDEMERARRIAKIQGNINIFVEGYERLAERKQNKSSTGNP